MRILKIDEKNRVLEVVPQTTDDLWHLERIIEVGDLVSGSSDRKIKPREKGEAPRRIKIFVKLQVEKVEFHRFSGNLRVLGIIVEGKPEELIELKSHQSLDVALGNKIKIEKKELKRYQIERLEKAKKATLTGKVLLVVLDDEIASFAILKEFALEEKVSIKSGKHGKREEEEESIEKKYFSEILEKINEINPERVIIAGPGFTKEKLGELLKEKCFAKQAFFTATNSVGITGLNELLKGNALDKAVQEMQIVKESKLVETLFEEIGKNSNRAVYGFEEVRKAIDYGAVQTLLVADKRLFEEREKIEALMLKAEQMRGEVHLINAEHEAGKKLQSITGIAALLRYPIQQ